MAFGVQGTFKEFDCYIGFADHTGKYWSWYGDEWTDIYGCTSRFFHEGLGAVRIGKKWGYVDKVGKLVIPAVYHEAFPFSDGRAVVSRIIRGNIRRGVIDRRGKLLVPFQWARIYAYKGGSALGAPWNHQASKTELLRLGRAGSILMESQRDLERRLCGFSGGPHVFEKHKPNCGGKNCGGLGLKDAAGNVVVPPIYRRIWRPYEGLAAVECRNKLWGVMDQKGKLVVPCRFGLVTRYVEGLAWVLDQQRRQPSLAGFIDKKGKVVISMRFHKARSFSQGLAAVRGKKHWGYVDRTGEIAISMRFFKAHSFKNGYAPVGAAPVDGQANIKNSGFGLIDRQGKYIVPPWFDRVYYPHRGLVRAEIRSPATRRIRERSQSIVYYNLQGKVVWTPPK